MKCTKILVAMAIATGSLFAGTNAYASFSITITVDENGNGTLTNTNGFSGTLGSGLQSDPGPGGLASALTYDLFNPPGLVAGDLIILDPGSFAVSDIVRYNPQETSPTGGIGALVFYSQSGAGQNSLADTGFPSALYSNNLAVIEQGPAGGPNGYTYTPNAGQPGFVAGSAGPVTYVIESDLAPMVPEPSSVVLGAIAAVTALGGALVRRTRKRA